MGLEFLFKRTCPLCGNNANTPTVCMEARLDTGALNNFSFSSRKEPELMHYQLLLCPDCDLLYAGMAPNKAFMAKAYKESDFDSSMESHYAACTYAKILDKFINRLRERNGALDVGTGDGAFLEQLLVRNFKMIQGVEPSEAPIKAACQDVRSLIRQEIFSGESFKDSSVDLFTSFQTIEHVHEPLDLCKEAYRILRNGGAIYLVCHNRLAASNRILGRKSPIFDIEHLQLFSPKSVKVLLSKSGFKNINIRSICNRYPLRYWLRLLPVRSKIKKNLLGLAEGLRIEKWPITLPVGNMAVVGFK